MVIPQKLKERVKDHLFASKPDRRKEGNARDKDNKDEKSEWRTNVEYFRLVKSSSIQLGKMAKTK